MNAVVLFSTMLLFFLVEYSIISFFPVYLTEYLDFTRSQIGYFVGLFSVSAFVVKFFSGYLIDRFGRLKIFLPAMALCVMTTCLFSVVSAFWSIMTVRLLHGLGSGVVRAVYPTLSVDISGQQRAGRLLGIIGMTATIAMFIASPLSYYIDQHFSHQVLFSLLVATGGAAVAAIPLMGIKRIKLRHCSPFKLASFLELTILDLAFLRFIGSTWHGLFLAYGLIYARELGVVNAGVILIAYASGNCLMRPVTGYVTDRFGPRLIGGSCYAFYFCGYLVFAGAHGARALCLGIFVVGLAVGAETILLQSMAAKSVGEQAVSRANSTIECFYSLGIVFGTIVLGHYSSTISFSQLFYLIGLLNIFPFVVFQLLVLPGYSRRVA